MLKHIFNFASIKETLFDCGSMEFKLCCGRFLTVSTSMQAAVLFFRWGWEPQTRYTLRHNTASIMVGWLG